MPHPIPFLEIKASYTELKNEIDAAYHRVMDSGLYILGPELEAFEAEFAAFCGAQHCIGVANGLEALELSLIALGIGAGDEVIVPSNTYIATWLAVSKVGAKIVPVEPRSTTYNLNPDLVEAAITETTKAIMPVHLYGHQCEMKTLVEIANKYNLAIVEDSAQMHLPGLSPTKGVKAGCLAAYSFYPTKNLGAFADAGAVVTNDPKLADKVRLLRNYGSRKKYYNEIRGQNSRLDPLQAAFLRVKLSHLEEWNARREAIVAVYAHYLSDCKGLTVPELAKGYPHGWHIYPVRHAKRDALQAYLNSQRIGTLIHYPVPPHLSEAYAELGYRPGDFPVSEEIHATELSLPIGPQMTLTDAEIVAEAVAGFCKAQA